MHNAVKAIQRCIDQHKRSIVVMDRSDFTDKEPKVKQAYLDYRKEVEEEIKELEEVLVIIKDKNSIDVQTLLG